MDCGSLKGINDGELVLNDGRTTFGAKVKYSCAENYTLVGSDSRVCGAQGNWEPEEPKCLCKFHRIEHLWLFNKHMYNDCILMMWCRRSMPRVASFRTWFSSCIGSQSQRHGDLFMPTWSQIGWHQGDHLPIRRPVVCFTTNLSVCRLWPTSRASTWLSVACQRHHNVLKSSVLHLRSRLPFARSNYPLVSGGW